MVPPRAAIADAIAHHYDVSNAFHAILLGPSLTYAWRCGCAQTQRSSGHAGPITYPEASAAGVCRGRRWG